MTGRLARLCLWAGLGASLAVIGYLLINTTLMPYDDEGFVLISLRNYLAGLPLYDTVFSQYGPWPYVYHQLATLNGTFELTHLFGRDLTLVHWVAMSLLSGAIAWRLTRSQLAALITAGLVFGLTWQMTSEPSHPGSMLSMLVAAGSLALANLPHSARPTRVMIASGCVTALLLLTKINVGLLLLAAVGCVVLRFITWPAFGRLLPALGAAGLLAVPWVLLGRQLHLGWALAFATIFTVSAAGILWVTPSRQLAIALPARSWIAGLLALALTAGAVCLTDMARGTSWHALVDTVLLGPLRMPARFLVALNWYWPVAPVTVVSALIVAKAGWDLRRQGALTPSAFWLVSGARVFALGAFLVKITEWPTYYGIFHFACYCLPLLPLFLIPLTARPDAKRHELARAAVAIVALLQVLHAFPVAGSQLAWATFLCVPALAAGTWDLLDALGHRWPARGALLRRAGSGVFVASTALVLGLLAHTGWMRYSTSRPLDLPGAESIRLDGRTVRGLHLLNLNASIHADVLFSRQGMYSHNLWSGLPTPTAQNATHWFWLLNEAQQKEIIARLDAPTRSAIITSIALDNFMVDFKVPVTGPLHEFILGHYRPLFQYADYIFHVPRESPAIPFGRFEIFETSDPTTPPLLLRAHLALDGTPIRLQMQAIDYPWIDGPELLGAGSRAVLEPIDRNGRATGDAISLPATGPLRGLFRLSLWMPPLPAKLSWQNQVVRVLDRDGRELSAAVY